MVTHSRSLSRFTAHLALFFVMVVLGGVFALPAPAHALFSGSLVPCGQIGASGGCPANHLRECTLCDAVSLIQRILNFLIFLSIAIATLLAVYAGFLMITAAGSVAQISQAKGIFLNVLIGIIILLSAWLIVNAIMTTLYRGNATGGDGYWRPWNQIICNTNAQFCTPLQRPGLQGAEAQDILEDDGFAGLPIPQMPPTIVCNGHTLSQVSQQLGTHCRGVLGCPNMGMGQSQTVCFATAAECEAVPLNARGEPSCFVVGGSN